MRTIELTNNYKRDLKRVRKGRHRDELSRELLAVVETLAKDETLPARYSDHALTGAWKGHRDCHVKPDLVLIYRKPDGETLELVRLGSHSELEL